MGFEDARNRLCRHMNDTQADMLVKQHNCIGAKEISLAIKEMGLWMTKIRKESRVVTLLKLC
jgi:hypothetical protein